jgi:hypothetical protein
MAGELEITGVRMGSPQPQGAPDPVTGVRNEFIDVTITVRNTTGQALHIIADARRILYDAATDTLTLRLEEQQPTARAPQHLFPPRFSELAAGETAELVVSVPADLKRITGATPDGVAVEQYDVRRTREVRVSVAHATEPFHFDKDDDPVALRRRLATWGGRTEVVLRPTRDHRAEQRGQEDDDAIPR